MTCRRNSKGKLILTETRRELNERMNHIESEMRASTRHNQILVMSVIGIAVAVIYSVLR